MAEDDIAYADELVKDYLLFRGFNSTFKAFQEEKKTDKTQGFKASKVVELLISYIQNLQLQAFLDLWQYLNENFFVKSTKKQEFLSTLQHLSISLKKYIFLFFFKF